MRLGAILVLVIAAPVCGQTAIDRTNAKNAYQQEWFALESANNGTAEQCEFDVAQMEQHEATEPAGQAAYSATHRKAQSYGNKAAAQALRDATYQRLNFPNANNPPTVGENESLLNAAYRYYVAGDNRCMQLFQFAKTLCELTKLDVMTIGVQQTQISWDENHEFNEWLANQGGGSGY